MFYLDQLCCVCLSSKKNMHLLFVMDNEGVSHYNKLKCVFESFLGEMKYRKFICLECAKNLNTAYNFQQQCTRSKTVFEDYLSQLRKYGNTSGNVSVKLKDFQRHMKIEQFKTRTACNRPTFEDVAESRNCKTKINKVVSNSVTRQFNNDHSFIGNTENVNEENHKIQIKIEQKNLEIYEENNSFLQVKCKEEIDVEEHLTPDGANELYIKTGNSTVEENRSLSRSSINEICYNSMTVENRLDNYTNHSRNIELFNNFEAPISNEDRLDGSTSQTNINNLINVNTIKVEIDGSTSQPNVPMSSVISTENGSLHECEFCKKVFPTPSRLNGHLRVHSSEKVLKPTCKICNQTFENSNRLKMHRREHKKVYICNVCKEQFDDIGSLKKHKLVHGRERKHECSICHKKFFQKGHLSYHSKVHSLGAVYECEICHKKYSYSHNLKQHMLTHSAVKPFQCEICFKRFNHKSNLNTHMNVHTADRRFQCNICLRKFTFKPNLKIHMLLHSGEKPYKCEICGYRVNRKDTLKNHMKFHEKYPNPNLDSQI